jgi:hypothetical protein
MRLTNSESQRETHLGPKPNAVIGVKPQSTLLRYFRGRDEFRPKASNEPRLLPLLPGNLRHFSFACVLKKGARFVCHSCANGQPVSVL